MCLTPHFYVLRVCVVGRIVIYVRGRKAQNTKKGKTMKATADQLKDIEAKMWANITDWTNEVAADYDEWASKLTREKADEILDLLREGDEFEIWKQI